MTITEPRIINNTDNNYTISIPSKWVDNMIDIDKPEYDATEHGDPLEDWLVNTAASIIEGVRGPSNIISHTCDYACDYRQSSAPDWSIPARWVLNIQVG